MRETISRVESEPTRFTAKQRTAIVAPVVLMATMYPVFRVLDVTSGDRLDGYLGWYLGLVIYWLAWGAGFSLWMLGPSRIRRMLRPRRPTVRVIGLIAFPVLMAGAVLFIPGMGYEKLSAGVLLLLLSTTIGNGVFEVISYGLIMQATSEIFVNDIVRSPR